MRNGARIWAWAWTHQRAVEAHHVSAQFCLSAKQASDRLRELYDAGKMRRNPILGTRNYRYFAIAVESWPERKTYSKPVLSDLRPELLPVVRL